MDHAKYAVQGHQKFHVESDTGEAFNFYIGEKDKRLADRMKGGFFEQDLLAEIRRRVPAGGVYIDCGASYGNHSLYFGKCCQAERVYSIEPNPVNVELLAKNVRKNGLTYAVDIWPWAVSNVSGRGELHYHLTKLNLTEVTLYDEGEFRVTTIDRICEEESIVDIDVIKIDCEAHSIRVLEGAEKTIRRCKPLIAVELFHWFKAAGNNLLRDYGYRQAFVSGRYTYLYEPVD